MSKRHLKGGALVAPVPAVMVSCGDMEKSNIITIAWCGITNTVPPKTYISVRPERYSYDIIKEKGEFVINLVPRNLAKTADYCGMYTGRKVDKFQKCHLTRIPSTEVAPPTIEEAPLALECRVREVIPLGTHDMFLADIVAVTVREELLDEKGKLCLERAGLAAYAHGTYYALGRRLGSFGYSAKKPKGRRRVR